MTTLEMKNVLDMPVEQRILLVEDMWDSIRPQSQRLPVPTSHKQELDRRFDKYKQDPSALLDDRQLRQALVSFPFDSALDRQVALSYPIE